MKRILFLASLLITAAQAWSATVDVKSAQATAQRFLQQTPAGRISAHTNLRLAHTEMNSKVPTEPVYYIFNADHGFVIVSGDDRAQAILAHGDQALDMGRLPIT